jgi:hypothetical protein
LTNVNDQPFQERLYALDRFPASARGPIKPRAARRLAGAPIQAAAIWAGEAAGPMMIIETGADQGSTRPEHRFGIGGWCSCIGGFFIAGSRLRIGAIHHASAGAPDAKSTVAISRRSSS